MLVIGHRGASENAPDNSRVAFELADSMGADGVELDVRISPDGSLLLAHDPLPSAGEALSALLSLDAGLDACGAEMLVNVEIKNSADDGGFDPRLAVVTETLAVLRRRGAHQRRRWLISSFSYPTIEACRDAAPDIATAWLCYEPTEAEIARVARAGHAAVNPWAPIVTEQLTEQCHALGLAVNTWTCNNPDRLRELESCGVDAVCTDVPDTALAALGRAAGRATGNAAATPAWSGRQA